MPLSLRDKLRAVDAPKKPSPAAPQAPVFDDCWHGSKLFPLESVPGAWDIPMDMVQLMEACSRNASLRSAFSIWIRKPPASAAARERLRF